MNKINEMDYIVTLSAETPNHATVIILFFWMKIVRYFIEIINAHLAVD